MVNKLQQTKPKLRWKKRYWWLAFATNFSLTFSLGGLMILISQGGASFFHHFLAYGYILVSSLLIASCMFGYFFIALRDYLKHYPKLKRTKTTSLRNGLGLNFLALLCYLVVSVITLIKLEAALETNTATTGHSKIFGAISSLGFLGIFLAINILFSISGFLYWTHFLFFMAADLFLTKYGKLGLNDEQLSTTLNNQSINDWNIITTKVRKKYPVLLTKNGFGRWTQLVQYYQIQTLYSNNKKRMQNG